MNTNRNDPFLSETHKTLLGNPASWLTKAEELWLSAELLAVKVEEGFKSSGDVASHLKRHQGAYFMICAYALENLLKGILVGRGRLDPKKDFAHDLYTLAAKANLVRELEPKVEWQEFLGRLERFSLWDGRYPAPKKPDRLSMTVTGFDVGPNYELVRFVGHGECDDIRSLYRQWRIHLKNTIKNSDIKAQNG